MHFFISERHTKEQGIYEMFPHNTALTYYVTRIILWRAAVDGSTPIFQICEVMVHTTGKRCWPIMVTTYYSRRLLRHYELFWITPNCKFRDKILGTWNKLCFPLNLADASHCSTAICHRTDPSTSSWCGSTNDVDSEEIQRGLRFASSYQAKQMPRHILVSWS